MIEWINDWLSDRNRECITSTAYTQKRNTPISFPEERALNELRYLNKKFQN